MGAYSQESQEAVETTEAFLRAIEATSKRESKS